MSKTFMYCLIGIAVYCVLIFPKNFIKKETVETEKADTKSGTGLAENPDENGISQGAAGQQKYRIGYTS